MHFGRNAPAKPCDSRIGAGTRIEGEVFFGGALRLDGSVRGRVRTHSEQTGTLVISESGHVDGEVAVRHLLVSGAVEGSVVGAETLDLRASARLRGDVSYTAIRVQAGAIIEATLVHRPCSEEKAAVAHMRAMPG